MVPKVLAGALTVICLLAGRAEAADPVVQAFYARCVTQNSYQMGPSDLADACACMAPVLVSFLTPEARRQVEDAIATNRPVSFNGSPYRGHPAELSRSAVKRCPRVGAAMYQQKCAGGNELAPECQEMKAMIDGAN